MAVGQALPALSNLNSFYLYYSGPDSGKLLVGKRNLIVVCCNFFHHF